MSVMVAKEQRPILGISPWQWRARLTDAVLGSFSLQSSGNTLPESMPSDKVFAAFYKLRNRYPEWLGSLYFEEGHDTLVCKGLEDVLFTLGAFGLVTVENHDYRYLRINREIRKIIKKQIEERSSEQKLKTLRRLSNEFTRIIGERNEGRHRTTKE